ncbi:MAG: circularly permuted type 2 ATP-grasp protein [Cyclobacteriaceae bacterium]|nr:circularly permuted type 2 ATP-grasp protein [Cyclobacteriaceae bacterium SS2]
MISSYLSERTSTNAQFFDELATADGNIYPHWQKLVNAYDKLGNEGLTNRAHEVMQLLKENGVTYNIYGDPEGLNRPWMLDPIPMVFSQKDWTLIEKGLKQRANLLNQILQDIYGERKLIRSGIIPFEMIYNHLGFLRQMDKIRIPGKHQLVQYSADLARGPDGKMWVLHDRTDAPSGAGYAFENRVAMTRVFPDMLRENHVRRVGSYYQTLKNTLSRLSWQGSDDPRIVFLSPGPSNETYFEHAYLSSYMGFTLAMGQDLTVSDGYVWLKTIGGLEKVDIIIRRVDDVFCDPLEFRMDSQLGVVGLMESVRQKKVLVINPMGVRILENPGLMAFLPKICQHVLDEDLILPSVATWWCGQEKEKQYVMDNIRFLMVRKIYRSRLNRSVYGGDLSEEQIIQLKNEIQARPHLYVAQELVNFSTTPSYINGKLEARNAVFRSYVVADTDNDDYEVMQGGLSRSSPDKGVFIVSNQSGGISKDTWILESEGKETHHLKPTPIIKQIQNIIPSRTGEHLFWLGRYIERSIYTVRLLRIILKKYYETADEKHLEGDLVITTLLKTLTAITGTQPGFNKKSILNQSKKELISLITDPHRVGSLSQSVQSFLNNAYSVRDRLSLDTWRILDSISDELSRMKNQASLHQINRNLDNLIIKLMAFHGLNIDNMTRENTWNILNIGRFNESARNTCIIIKTMLSEKRSDDVERMILEYLLMTNESLVTYRYMYRSTLEVKAVLNLLLIDELNPKSVTYQVERIDQHINKMPDGNNRYLNPIRKKLLEINTKVRLYNAEQLVTTDKSGKHRKELVLYLESITSLLGEVYNLINEQYFSHTQNRYGFVTTKLPEV